MSKTVCAIEPAASSSEEQQRWAQLVCFWPYVNWPTFFYRESRIDNDQANSEKDMYSDIPKLSFDID